MEVDIIDGEVNWNEVMRIRIKLDATKPLAYRKKVKIWDGATVWVQLAYECLPKFYYYYRIIGHCHRDCHQWILVKDHLSEDHFPYGQWLWAQPQEFKNGNQK